MQLVQKKGFTFFELHPNMIFMITVYCHSGYLENEKPVSFDIGGMNRRIEEIIDSWYGESSVHFKVLADDLNIYLIKYDNLKDEWDMVFFQDEKKINAEVQAHWLIPQVLKAGASQFESTSSHSVH